MNSNLGLTLGLNSNKKIIFFLNFFKYLKKILSKIFKKDAKWFHLFYVNSS